MDLSLEISSKHCHSLLSALDAFYAPETLDGANRYKCPKCKQKVRARKQFTIKEAPQVLTVQLKRFGFGPFGRPTKLNKRISYPQYLNLDAYLSSSNSSNHHMNGQNNSINNSQAPSDCPQVAPRASSRYCLYGVLVHDGPSMFTGHYYTFALAPSLRWYRFDDTQVTAVTLDTVLSTHNAYVLFYLRDTAASSHPAINTIPENVAGNIMSFDSAARQSLSFSESQPNAADNLLPPKNDVVSLSTNTKLNLSTSTLTYSSIVVGNDDANTTITTRKRKVNNESELFRSEESSLLTKRQKLSPTTTENDKETAFQSLTTPTECQLQKSNSHATPRAYYLLSCRQIGRRLVPVKILLPSDWKPKVWVPQRIRHTISLRHFASVSSFAFSALSTVSSNGSSPPTSSQQAQGQNSVASCCLSACRTNPSLQSAPLAERSEVSARARLLNPRLVHAPKIRYNSETTANIETNRKLVAEELSANISRYQLQAVTPAWNTHEAQNAKIIQTTILEDIQQREQQRRTRDPYDIEYDRGKLKKVRNHIDPFATNTVNKFQQIQNLAIQQNKSLVEITQSLSKSSDKRPKRKKPKHKSL